MAVTITVVSKATSSVVQKTTNTHIDLHKASIVEIGTSRSQVKNIHQKGNAVVVVLKNGEVITVDHFFGSFQNELVFDGHDGKEVVQFVNHNGVFTPAEYLPFSSGEGLAAGGGLLPLAILGGAGAVGAIIAGNSGGGSDDDGDGDGDNGGNGLQAPTINQNPNSTDTTPTITGTAQPGTVITLTDNGQVIGSTTTDGNGNWSFTPTTPLPVGPQSVTATATANGQTSPASGADNFTINPAAPVINPTPDTTDTTPTITGTAPAGSLVTLYDNGQVIGTTTADANGNWSFTPTTPLSLGTQLVVCTAAMNGATSGESNQDDFNIGPLGVPTINQNPNSTDTTPTITGTATAGATVTLVDNGQVIGSTTAGPNGTWSFTPTTPLPVGHQSVTATATLDGQTSAPSSPDNFDINPLAPFINQTANSTDTTPTITGTAPAGSVVTLTDNGQVIGSTTADAAGNWSFTPTTPLALGNQLVLATATVNGATSAQSNPDAFTISSGGSTLPAPIIDQTVSSTDTTPTITGTATPGALVTLTDNGQVIGSTVTDAAGNWTFTPTTPLAVGSQSVTAVATLGGQISPVSNTDNFTITSSANPPPPAPTIDQTASSTDTTPTITGTAPAGSLVTLSDNGQVIGTTTADANGNWSFTPTTPLAIGLQSVTAIDTVNGVDSPPSAPDVFAIQPTAPIINQTPSSTATVPTITGTALPGAVVTLSDNAQVIGTTTADAAGNWSFTPSTPLAVGHQSVTAIATLGGQTSAVSNTDNFDVNPQAPFINQTASTTDTTPTITGTAPSNSVVTLTDNGQVIGTATADGLGNWTFTPTTPLALGNQLVLATATLNGVTSGQSNPDAFSITSGALAAPTINQTINSIDTTPTITGTAPAGSVVTLTDNGQVIGSTTADAAGNWSFTPTTPLAVGHQSVTATATLGGQTSAPSGPDNFDVNPEAPFINQNPNSTDTTPTITGTAPAGSLVTLTDNGQVIGTTTADAAGNWSFTPTTPLVIGIQFVEATATLNDVTSWPSNPDVFTITSGGNPLPAPIIDQTANSTDTTPTITGTAPVGSIVTLTDNGQVIGSTTADSAGNWSFTPTIPLAVGSQSVTAVATLGGQTSPVSNTDNFTITSVVNPPPPAPTIDQTASSTDTTPTITGTAPAGSLVTLTDNGQVIGTTTADAAGNWSFTPTTPLVIGMQSVTAIDTVNGVDSPPSTTDVFTVQPFPPTIAQTANTSDTTPTIMGMGVPGSTVTLYDNGVLLGTVTVAANGSWSFVPSTPLSLGSQTVTATDTVNGITSALSAPDVFQIVTPLTDQIWGYQDLVSGIQGNVYSGGQSDDPNGTLYGRSTPGATVTVYDGATLLGNATVDALGNWSYTFSNLTNGTHTFNVVASDSTGATVSNAFVLTEYTSVAPVVAATNNALLGIVGLNVAGLINLNQQALAVADQNGDLTLVTVNLNEPIALNIFQADTWAWSTGLATYLGLNVSSTSIPLLAFNANMTLTVTAGNGQAVLENQAILELLGSVTDSAGIASISLFNTLTVTGTDSQGHVGSQAINSLVNVGVLSTLLGSGTPGYIHQSNTAGATINDSANIADARLYAFGASSTLIAGSGNDILRTMGGGTNTLTAGSGMDWLDGGSGTNTFNMGTGHDTVHYGLLNILGRVTGATSDVLGGHSGLDVINNFHIGLPTDASADYLDITALVGPGANAGNIDQYVSISYNAGTHSAVVSIDRAGDGIPVNYHQLLTLNVDNSYTASTLTVQDLMTTQQLIF